MDACAKGLGAGFGALDIQFCTSISCKLNLLHSKNPLGTRYLPCKAAAEGLFSMVITLT